MITCTKCHIEKDDEQFQLHKTRKGNYLRVRQCKLCQREYYRERYHRIKHTDMYKSQLNRRSEKLKASGYWKIKYKTKDRERHILREYGMTKDDYQRMNMEQKGICAICGCSETALVNCSKNQKKTRSLSIDHNHTTGKVRALLCNRCNVGLARFNENIEYLANAISYLEKYNKYELAQETAEQMAGV